MILSLPSIRFDINLQNLKKPLAIFSSQIERKRSKDYLVIILPVKESLKRFSCLAICDECQACIVVFIIKIRVT